MNAISSTPFQVSLFGARARTARINWGVIAQLCICAVPALAILGLGHPVWGARYVTSTLALFLAYHAIHGHRHEFLALTVGALPALVFLRGLFFYSGLTFFLTVGIFLWASIASDEVRFIWQDATWRALLFLLVLYWWLSFVNTHDYTANMRIIELLLSSTAVYLLSSNRSSLATALFGFAIVGSVLAISLLPYGDRLGEADIDGINIGNAALMGLPSALAILLAIGDRGRLLFLDKRPVARILLALTAAVWLILSGSRGGWLVAAGGGCVLLAFSRLSRKTLLLCLGTLTLVTLAVLASSRGDSVRLVYDRTFNSERSMKNRTSFRSEQWAALPKVFVASPIWGWGPGSGKDVDYLFTGRHLLWHALYLQVIGETGSIGMIALLWILGSLIFRSVGHLRKWGEAMPLVGIITYMMIGLSVSGFDAFSGVYMGLAFMAREQHPRLAFRRRSVKIFSEPSEPVIDVEATPVNVPVQE